MTVHRCETRCGRPSPGTAICPDCGRRLKKDLRAVPGLLAELELTLTRQTAMGRPEGGRSAEKPLPYAVAASDALDQLRHAWRQAETSTDVGWVFGLVTRAVEKARRVIDRPPERRYAGTCGNDEDREPCTQELYADPGEGWVKCPRCARNWDVEARRGVLLSVVRDRVVNAATLSAALTQLGQPVEANTLRQWAKRKKIVSVGSDQDGRPMYVVGDILDLIDAQEREALAAYSNTV